MTEQTYTPESPRYRAILVRLTGRDGNAFAIINSVSKALRRASVPAETVQEFTQSCLAAQSYDELLTRVRSWVSVA